mgnify:CR=1 FL=1
MRFIRRFAPDIVSLDLFGTNGIPVIADIMNFWYNTMERLALSTAISLSSGSTQEIGGRNIFLEVFVRLKHF